MGIIDWLFKVKPDNFTGEDARVCPTCNEQKGAHNKCRNRACSEQLGKENFPKLKATTN